MTEVHLDMGSTLVNRKKSKLVQLETVGNVESSITPVSEIEENDDSLENAILTKIDAFLNTFEGKLDYAEKYLKVAQKQQDSTSDESEQTAKDAKSTYFESNSIIDSPAASKLYGTMKSILSHNREHGLHPLSQVIDNYYAHEQLIGETPYQRLLHALQLLDNKITEFENKYDIMPKHPQERLDELKQSLYNYDKALGACKERCLNFYELPFQWRENKFLIYGYKFTTSHTNALSSIGCTHNETANIWSHLLGAASILLLSIYHFPTTSFYQKGNFIDHLVMYQFIASAIVCLLFSVIWHTYTNISILDIRSKFACFDYTGITILIISSIITTEHLALYYHPIYKYGFISFSIFSGIFGVILAWHPFFDKPGSRPFRILFFIALSALGVSAFGLASYIRSFNIAFSMYKPLLGSFAWYLCGVFFYGYLFPERLRTDVIIDEFEISDETIMELDKSGKLQDYLERTPELTGNTGFWTLHWVDYIGNSHNFWHLFVLGGIMGHYWGVLKMFDIGIINHAS